MEDLPTHAKMARLDSRMWLPVLSLVGFPNGSLHPTHEHLLGKGEVDSSILSGSTTHIKMLGSWACGLAHEMPRIVGNVFHVEADFL